MSQMSIPKDSLTLYLALQIDLQDQGQRDSVQTSRSGDPYNDGNHGNQHGFSMSNVHFGSGANLTFVIGQGSVNQNTSKKE